MSPRRPAPRRPSGGAGRPYLRPWLLAVALAGASTLLSLGLPARAQDSTSTPVPAFHGYVNDEAGVIGGPRAAQLESFLDQLEQKTGVQFAVLTVASCEPEEPETYKTRVFQTWGIGNKERADGLLLLVSMKEHAILFESGYGLEGTLPDGWQARMLRDLAVPRFRAGDPAEGITAAVLAAAQRIAAEKAVKLEWDGRELHYDEEPGGLPAWVIMLVLFFVIFVLLPALIANRGRRRRRWFYPGGWGGGFGGFGGGFGGGGFGGGGGGGFGGFGGGSSGGGGGGARW